MSVNWYPVRGGDTKRKMISRAQKTLWEGRTEFGAPPWILTFTQHHYDAETSLVRTWGLPHFMCQYYQAMQLCDLLDSKHVKDHPASEYN